MQRQLRREDYTVGWVCALPVELAAARAMLDERHTEPRRDIGDNDENVYSMGSIAGHNVVIVCLPAGRIGNNPAAAVATQMRTAFKNIRFGLMVGIGGGVPSTSTDIRLGDVVVSQPEWTFGGVVQYDFGRRTSNGLERIGSLNSPPKILLSALNDVQANTMLNESTLSDRISTLERIPTFQRCKAGPDILFKADYKHQGGATCDQCSIEGRQTRLERKSGEEVIVHYGTIASGNQVIKDAAERDRISAELGGVLCFEMEAAGLMNDFQCLVIRGISDYADSHKNYKWQPHAAGTAAAYAKELLSVIQPTEVMNTPRVEDAMPNGENKRCRQPSFPIDASYKRPKTVIFEGLESSSPENQTITLPIHSQEPSRTLLNDEQRQSLLESLRFEQIDARQMTIKTAHAKTCKWLSKSEQYLDWLDTTKLAEHHGFLWIKGKAGTGKSTLMKYALANARRTMKGHIILSFFFNARGEDIEKSTIGTYRSVLLQLLERLPTLHSVFDSLSLSASKLTADHQWNIETLKTLLEQAIRSLGDSSLICFIDALDECEEEQVRDMIQFFEHIGDLTVSHGIRFQVCFSSRHYPHITIRNGIELVLEGQEGHSQDITNYVETELKIGKSKSAQNLRAELQEKASGIFMWVVLVVGILNKASDRGQPFRQLQRKLQEIPPDLHDLFHDILTRDLHNKDGLVLCIQWVLFAKQPLSPEQLYHAILSGVDLESVTEWDPEEITKDVIRRFVLDSSKGLAEVTVSKQQRVQFIHESVRDFLLKDNGLSKIWPEYENNFQGQSHDWLKQCCLNYISIDVATPLDIPDELPKASSQQAADLRKSATQKFPFLEYATHNVLYHADAAQEGGVSQADFIDSFPRSKFVKLDNLFEKHEVRRHTKRVSLLYLLAESNAANLIRASHFTISCLDVEYERYGCAFFAAHATGGQEAVQACIERFEAAQAVAGHGRGRPEENSLHKGMKCSLGRDFKYSEKIGILGHAMETGSVALCSFLIGLGIFDPNSTDKRGRTALCIAAAKGEIVLVRMLLERGAKVNSVDTSSSNALCIASDNGYKEIVMLLLEYGAHVNMYCGEYYSALNAACIQGHQEIVEVLLDKGANVDAQHGGKNALCEAVRHGREQIAILLLDKGADVNAQGGYYGNALQAATAKGYKEIVMLLLDKGADVNAQGGYHGRVLQAATAKGYKEIVMLLLDKGADVNAQGGLYGGALQAASTHGHKETVALLLDRGADVNAVVWKGGFYGNALQAASTNGHKETVALLLDRGADANAQGGHYGNALQAATAEGHKEIVELLLDKGADVNAQGGYYGNALQAATAKGYKEIVMLLLDRGADVNARGGLYGNALYAASNCGCKEIVELLLDKGADINAENGHFDNALQAALYGNHEDVAALLRDRGVK